MSKPASQALYEELTQICSEFSQRPQHHLERVALLTCPQHQWVELREILPVTSSLYTRLERLEGRGVTLVASHATTPDEQWSLVNFYSSELDALPATALLLRRAHNLSEGH